MATEEHLTPEKIGERWFVGSYRHSQPHPRGNLYRVVRLGKKLSQRKMADHFGVTWDAWKYRERTKRLYHIAEICALHEASGLTARQFINLLREIA